MIAGRAAQVKDALQTQLWPLPALAVVVAVVLGIALPALDAAVDGRLPQGFAALLFGGGPEAARAVLQAIAGSLITVTSLTFSLTVVTLQLASSQFSPRLLRTFSSDRFVHTTLALFLATFAFALAVLRSVRTETSQSPSFVREHQRRTPAPPGPHRGVVAGTALAAPRVRGRPALKTSTRSQRRNHDHRYFSHCL